ncbi:glycosyltransferase family 4 protein [Yoonia sp.]|uniref:glycosyltransferase family 4 protein n=1 Tax=Yoonia sp. TaxID=2212373 RepID=UPI00391C3511
MIYLAALIVTLSAGLLLVRYHEVVLPNALERQDNLARQASHVGEPLRYGGIAVFAGLCFACFLLRDSISDPFFLLLLISSAPVIVTGFAEDLGYAMSPRRRLLAAMVSAAVAIALLGVWVPRADLPVFDRMMSLYIIALPLTVLFSAGFCHAVNLIDGMNGLATTNGFLSALGLAMIAANAAETDIMIFALVFAACLMGFLALNWPSARMFLGDAGAYGIGHLLTWLAILLVARVDDVAVPALLLVLFWPLADVLHTIYRRLLDGKAAFQPDRMHLHHKVRRALDMVYFGYNEKGRSNPLTTLVLGPFIAVPIFTGAFLWDQPVAAWIALIIYMIGFALAHKLTTRYALRNRKSAQ